MSKKYDVMMRTLYDREPADWLDYLRIPVPDPGQLRILDSNVSTIGAEVDKAVWVGGPEPLIVHTEFLSGRDLGLPQRSFWYNTLLSQKHNVPVWSVIVLLRPAADGPELTGVFEKSFPGRGQGLLFRYDVIRIWLEPPEKLLTSGLAVLPLAPVSNVAPEQLEGIVRAVAERLKREAAPQVVTELWTATTTLMGLRHRREQVKSMMEGVAAMFLDVRGMKESWVYQDIFAEGKAEGRAEGAVEEARNALLRVGRKKLGEPNERVLSLLAALGDLDRLNLLLDALLEAARWDDLLPLLHG
jgi:hypothetical protein